MFQFTPNPAAALPGYISIVPQLPCLVVATGTFMKIVAQN
jgi:hypothetical protein